MSTRSPSLKVAAVQAANGDHRGYQASQGEQGQVVRVAGSVVGVRGLRRARINDVVLIGDRRLPGEIIRLAGEAGEKLGPDVVATLGETLADHVRANGVWGRLQQLVRDCAQACATMRVALSRP